MARRGIRGGDDDSMPLDLFLDTICNAFGGVVFIAILIAVMLQLTGPPAAGANPAAAPAAAPEAGERYDLAVEMEELKARKALLAEMARSMAPQEDADPALVERAHKLQARAVELAEQVDRQAQQLEQMARAAAESGSDVHEQALAAADLEARLSTLRVEIEQAMRVAPQRIRLPRAQQASQAHQVGVLVAEGRARFQLHYDADGTPVARNADDVIFSEEVVNGARMRAARPMPGRGWEVTTDEAGSRFLRRALSSFTPDRHYIMIAVWPDSFGAAARLRDALLELGFDYGLVIMEEGEPVYLGPVRGRTQ